MKIDFAIMCHGGDKDKMYQNFPIIYESHKFKFNKIIMIHQRCDSTYTHDFATDGTGIRQVEVCGEDCDELLTSFGIPSVDHRADEITHGIGSPHYWKNHVVNHLAALSHTAADYMVFSDSDCVMVKNEPENWVWKAKEILESNTDILAVSPSEGSPGTTPIMSQQLFMANTDRLANIDWNCWDGVPVEGGPFIEYYVMGEGRIGMYMRKHSLLRLVLSDNYRYFHDWTHHSSEGFNLPGGLV